MKTFVSSLWAIFFTFTAFAQPQSHHLGEIEPEYLKMTTYDADPTASALVLMSRGEVTFSDEGIVLMVHKRIKVLNKDGLSFANLIIPYYADEKLEHIDKLKARSYKLDAEGKVVESKFDNKNLLDEDIDGYFRQKKAFIPNVVEGSVIEYTYELTSQRYGAVHGWYFQQSEPVLWSEYSICIPSAIKAITLQQGTHEVIEKTESCFNAATAGVGYHWIAQNLPAMRPESYVNNIEDYMSRILVRIQTIRFPGQVPIIIMGDWQKTSTDLLQSQYFGEKLSLLISPELHQIVNTLTANATDPKAKMKAIYNYVHTQMAWNGDEGIYPTMRQSLKKAHDLHKGNAADINLLLTYMLRAADIEADPVLASTLNNGAPVPAYPSSTQFNQVLSYVHIGNEEYLLDATEPMTPYTLLAQKNLNQQVFILDKKNPRWMPIKAPKVSKNVTLIEASVLPNKQLKMNVQKSETNYQAVNVRETVAELKEQSAVKEMLEGAAFPITIDSFGFTNLTETLEDAVKLKIKCSTELPESGDFITIGYNLNHPFAQNPFKASERFYPIDFIYPSEFTYNFILNLPANSKVETIPAPLKLSFSGDNALLFNFTTEQTTDGKIQINTKLNINRTLLMPEEYADLRLFFDKVAEKMNELIVLKQ